MWASSDDVLIRWVGSPAPDDLELVQTVVEDAETVLVTLFPDLPARVPSEVSVPVVVQVVAQMAIRHLRNPDAVRQTTETEGPFSRNRTFAGDIPGSLWPSDEERQLLGYGKPSRRAFTFRPAPVTGAWLGGPHGW